MSGNKPIDEAESLRRLEAGGLPLRAEERLAEARERGPSFFTSTLTVGESVLAHAIGLEPISQVMGSSFYHVGWQSFWSGSSGEVEVVTTALYEVRRRALSRLWQEARALGAHAVVGVDVRSKGWEHSGATIELTCTGTAVRIKGAPPTDSPALTLMNADQLWKARIAGYWPVAIAMANTVWLDTHCDCYADGAWNNTALSGHNRVCEQAERVVQERFHQHVRELGADGVVGVRLLRHGHDRHYEINDREHTDFRLEMVLMGTAVKRIGKHEAAAETTLPVIDLSGRKRKRAEGAGVELKDH